MRVILDTNFLIYCIENKIHIEPELERIIVGDYKIAIIDKILLELKKLALKPKTKTSAQIALKLAQKYEIIESNGDETVDDLIVKNAKKKDFVATMDRELQKRLECPIIIIRQKKYFEVKNNCYSLLGLIPHCLQWERFL